VLIDWFTVFAQVINFLVLIIILKHFLYGPIIKAMDKRERRIADQLQQAEQARLQAAAISRDLELEKETLLATRQDLFDKAQAEVFTWRDHALQEAHLEIEQQRQAWLENIKNEQESFKQQLKERLGHQVFRTAEKVLRQLADAGLEVKLTENFLQALENDPVVFFKDGLEELPSIEFRSGFKLNETLRNRIRKILLKYISATEDIHFAVQPDLGFGLQLLAGDRKVEWNMKRYLQEMESDVLRNFTFATGKTS